MSLAAGTNLGRYEIRSMIDGWQRSEAGTGRMILAAFGGFDVIAQ